MNNVSKKKIAAGYAVLLAVLLYSLFFVHREMENLMSSDNSDILRTDSLIGLLREKDANTVRLLRTLSEANDSMISAREVEQIIAEQDTIITQQRVQRRVIARRDTVAVSYTHLRAHETGRNLVCRLLLEKKKKKQEQKKKNK